MNRHWRLTEKRRPRLIEYTGGVGRHQDFSEILKDLDIVVNNQNSSIIGSNEAYVTISG
ncbi:MAG TPA: hypothetical protein VK901_14370 [Nitrospiraceae bacterium]|nr:hypothetical protein [Nitrospiraceae bacterium]